MNLTNLVNIFMARDNYVKEDHFQKDVASFLDGLTELDIIAWFHPAPNTYIRGLHSKPRGTTERAGSDKLAAILGKKGIAAGVKAGVPDCIIHSHKVALELKTPNGKMKQNQKDWFTQAEQWGWHCYCCHSPKEVMDALLDAGILKKKDPNKDPKKDPKPKTQGSPGQKRKKAPK